MSFDPAKVGHTPSYVCEEEKLRANVELIGSVGRESDAEIIVALKGFAMPAVFDIIMGAAKSASASSLYEAKLGHEGFGSGVHLYSPAYKDEEFDELLSLSSHIIFNSFGQWRKFRGRAKGRVKCGIRVNLEHKEVKTDIYNPSGKFSRLGVTEKEFRPEELEGISGLHFHNLCECGADSLVRSLEVFEKKFGKYFDRLEWVNFGGGHFITKKGYDVELLVKTILSFRQKYALHVILEPGAAFALDAGVLVASVVDVVRNDMDIAILDVSASTHMPDVLEMPYRPEIFGAGPAEGESRHKHVYRLGGPSCLAGDVIGDYSFKEPLKPGDRLVFGDMMQYTMVKNTNFNGIALPEIGIWSDRAGYRSVRKPSYEEYRSRLS